MAEKKKNEKKGGSATKGVAKETANALWRKPITLDSFEDNDPLETLYRGRESATVAAADTVTVPASAIGAGGKEKPNPKLREILEAEPIGGKPKTGKRETVKKETEKAEDGKAKIGKSDAIAGLDQGKRTSAPLRQENFVEVEESASPVEAEYVASRSQSKLSERELKDILRIKSETFQFTDIREILRGNSFEMYTYLRYLAGAKGVCKIKHNDLMRTLDISRPTLFKQGDWLVRLSLIEKQTVPGDHLGTSYAVHRIEDVLPVSKTLVEKVETAIEELSNIDD